MIIKIILGIFVIIIFVSMQDYNHKSMLGEYLKK